MSRYSQEIIEQVRTANDIIDVIGGVVELKPSGGGRLAGLCPFHQDSAPSFTVNRDRQNFYCFGCEQHGDVFGFVMEHEGLTFVEALRKLADRGRVHLPAPTGQDSREEMLRSRLLDLGTFAQKKYVEALKSETIGAEARTYLASRALKPETAETYGVGFAPEQWQFLLDAGRAKGYDQALVLDSGLAKRNDRGSVYDLFRNRLMFPIRNPSGDVIAFGGRDLSGTAPGKYINSPENAVYKKNRTLYGVYEARDAMRKADRALLCEGYFDVLRCHDAGLKNAVATCGTALTAQQGALLRRYVREVVMLFDGDTAGIKAALKGVAILAGADLAVRAVVLPDGQDPDDFVRAQGAEALRDAVDRAENFVTFYVKWSQDRLETIEGRTEVARELFGILRSIQDDLRRDEYLKLVASELRLDPYTVRREFDGESQKTPRRPVIENDSEAPAQKMSKDDLYFVAALLYAPALVDQVRDGLKDTSLPNVPVTLVLRDVLNGGRGDSLAESDAALALLHAASNIDAGKIGDADVIVDRRVRRLKRDALELRRAHLQQELVAGREAADAAKLLAEKISVEREIEAIGAV